MPSVQPFRGSCRAVWALFYVMEIRAKAVSWFVSSCVRMWFGRGGGDGHSVEGGGNEWFGVGGFLEFIYFAFQTVV